MYDGYFDYLLSIIQMDGEFTYYHLLDILYRIDFRWSIHNDDNRISDAYELRYNYQRDCNIRKEEMEELMLVPCSIIEVICGLAIHMDEIMRDPERSNVGRWFWELIGNLGLLDFTDGAFERGQWDHTDVEKRMDILMDRTYDELGHGGLFPRNVCYKNQQTVELFEQMNGYLCEFYC